MISGLRTGTHGKLADKLNADYPGHWRNSGAHLAEESLLFSCLFYANMCANGLDIE
jgi:hypothetical protein